MPGAIMKSLVRWSATVGLVGATLVGSLVASGLQALALTPEQIVQKLRTIPAFTLADKQGAPLVAAPTTGQKGTPEAPIFISQKDAQAFLEGLKTRNPNLAKEVKVVPVSLAEVYQLGKANQGKPDQLVFTYVPTKQQVDSAVAVLKQNGQQVNQFNATPLFALGQKKGDGIGFLTLPRENQRVIPMFFEKEQVQALLTQLKQKVQNLPADVQIQVIPLENVLQEMQSSNNKDPKNQEFLSQIELVPSVESIQFIQSIQKAAPAQNKPQASPSKPKK
jgi:Tic22-like family